MTELQFVIAVIGALWTSLTSTFSASKQLNDLRDVIIVGKIGDNELSRKHRMLMLQRDWLPLQGSIAWRSIVFAFIIFVMPELTASTADKEWIRWIAYACVSIPALTILSSCFHLFAEYRFIRDAIRSDTP